MRVIERETGARPIGKNDRFVFKRYTKGPSD